VTVQELAAAALAWLRVPVLPTVTRAEVVFAVPIFVALAASVFSLTNALANLRATEAAVAAGRQNGGSQLTAREGWRRAAARAVRVLVWAIVATGLLTDWDLQLLVFTTGALVYALGEAADALVEVLFTLRLRTYLLGRRPRPEQPEAEAP
jgi:hypothetical protein